MNDAKKSDITQIVSMTQFELRMKLDDARLAQRALDEAELGKELLYVVNKTTERVKKEMIAKTCDYCCSLCPEYHTEECPGQKYCANIIDYRKAMEE